MPFDTFATRMFLGVASALAAVSVVQPDFWWLLRAGHDIWRTGEVPLVDHYSYTAAGRDWPNHEWLWEAVVYPLHQLGGMPLVATLTAATVLATLSIVVRLTTATGYAVPVVLVLAVPLASVSWTMRPQVTSLLMFAITTLLLVRERYRWIPVLFIVWANTHAQVVMGAALLATATLVAVGRWATLRSEVERARVVRIAAVTALSAVATLATPLGTGLWSYVLDANGRPRQHEIEEWHNAFEAIPPVLWFWAVLALALVLAISRRDRLTTWNAQVAVAATVPMALLAILAVRNIPFFAIAVIPLLTILTEFHPSRPVGTVQHARRVLVAAGAIAAAVVVTAWAVAPHALGWRPVPAGLGAAVRACPGHLFNDYESGAELIWWVPDVKVFVDNRQDPYPAAVLDSLFDVTRTSYRTTFARYDVRCALVRSDDVLGNFLRDDGWRTTYVGETGSVWVPPSTPRATTATE